MKDKNGNEKYHNLVNADIFDWKILRLIDNMENSENIDAPIDPTDEFKHQTR